MWEDVPAPHNVTWGHQTLCTQLLSPPHDAQAPSQRMPLLVKLRVIVLL